MDSFGYYSLKTGTQAIPYQYSQAKDFYEGYAVVSTGENGESLYGLIDQTGQQVIPCQFTYLSAFFHGIAIATTSGEGENAEYGCIDLNGQWVMQYDRITYTEPELLPS